MEQKQLLTNVAIIRPTLIVLLVFYHAFAPYSGAWPPIDGFPDMPVYWWLDKLSYAFMLETFVFISGYVFGYQVRMKGKSKLKVKNLLGGKFKRLMIPSMVFSFFYILLLKDITQPIGRTFYGVINGVAHMWFLPMLFWCFVMVWIIEKLHLRTRYVLALLLICSILSFVSLPLQLNHTMYYMLFFYIGYIIQRNNISIDKYYTSTYCIVLILLFVILFPSLTLIKEYINGLFFEGSWDLPSKQIITKIIHKILINLVTIIYSLIGLAMLFVCVGTFEKKHHQPLPQWLINVGNLCMGVYLFQQFILMALYKHTILPAILGPVYLPWISFVIALIGSFSLSYIFNKNKIGRLLIG